MQLRSKFKVFLKITQLIIIIFGAYLAVSLFEGWALFPFWVKNLALGISLAAIYWFSRKTIIMSRNGITNGQNTGLSFLSLVVIGVLVWGGMTIQSGLSGRIIQAVTFNLTQPPRDVLLTVKIAPPDYLNQDDVILITQKDGPVSIIHSQENLTFPEGSIITVEVSETENYTPFISLGNSLGKNQRGNDADFRSQHVLNDSATLDIKVGPYISFRQGFTVIPDLAPELKIAEAPVITQRNSYEFQIAFWDDHGVTEAYIELRPRGLPGNKSDIIPLPVMPGANSEIPQTLYVNLISHPWAGTTVNGIIKVVDGLGQVSESDSFSLSLPEKTFSNPVAQNLASIRQSLIITPERKNAQVRRLDLLTSEKEAYQNNISIYLSLRSAYWKLRSAETAKDIEEVTRYLWQTALKVEGDGSFEEQNIQTLVQQIRLKLAAGKMGDETGALIGGLRARVETLVDREYMLLTTRLSLNEDIDEASVPGFIVFNTLISGLRNQVEKGDIEAASKTLTTFQAMFEKRPAPKFQ